MAVAGFILDSARSARGFSRPVATAFLIRKAFGVQLVPTSACPDAISALRLPVMMESPKSLDVELPPVAVLDLPLEDDRSLSQPVPVPQYVISPQEVTIDRGAPLGTTRRGGNVFTGSWSNGVVAVKILSNDAPVDVTQIWLYRRILVLTESQSKLQTLLDRVKCWQSFEHAHVLQVFGVSSLDAEPPFIISQYCPNGNANEFLTKNRAADRAKIVSLSTLNIR